MAFKSFFEKCQSIFLIISFISCILFFSPIKTHNNESTKGVNKNDEMDKQKRKRQVYENYERVFKKS